MKTSYKARYYDGKSAAKHDVTVEVTSSAIKITAANGSFIEWKFGEFIQTQGLYENDDLKLEKKKPSPDRIGEAIVIRDKAFLEYLFQFLSPQHKSDFETKKKLKRMIYFIPVGTVLAAIVLWFFNAYVLPYSSKVIANRISPSYEKTIGRDAMVAYNEGVSFCGADINGVGKDRELNKVMQSMVDTYAATLKDNPYEFNVYIINSKTLNAYALPKRYIVFYTGLIEKTDSPEQMAGVLAHEMQHVIRKHSMRHVVRQNLVSFASTAFFGNDMGAVANAATMFSTLSYSRSLETEADIHGAALMADSNVDINGMAEFFELLHKKEKDTSEIMDADYFEYISTHPLSKNRTAYIREMAEEAEYNPKPIFKDLDWDKVKKSCSVNSATKK